MKTTTILSFLILSCLYLPAQLNAGNHTTYPAAPRSTAADTLWGVAIPDPFRALEHDTKARQEWLDAEEEQTKQYLKAAAHKWDMDFDSRNTGYSYQIPYRSGPYYIDQLGSSVYYKSYIHDRNRFLYSAEMLYHDLDHLDDADFSRDGKYCALTYSPEANDWQEVRILNTNNDLLLKDHLYDVRLSDVQWFKNGFFYSRFDSIKGMPRATNTGINQKIYYHKVSTDQSADELVFEDPDYEYNESRLYVTEDERWVFISEFFPEQDRTITFARDYSMEHSAFHPLFSEIATTTRILAVHDDTLVALSTNNGAYNGQIVEIDTKNPRQWSVIVENQEKYRIKDATQRNGKIITILQEGFQEYICIFSPDGKVLKTHVLPEGSSSHIICHASDQKSILIKTANYTCPPIGQLLSLADLTLTPMKTTEADYNTFHYKYVLTHYQSRDSTIIPIYLVMSADYIRQGPGAALLEIYGGFGRPQEPSFNPGIFSFLNNGGIYAIANVRGGASCFKDWHKDGTILHKQNSIDDVYYAARFLADSGLAQPGRIGVMGAFNGALIAAAAINQHPEAFKAAILQAGLYDMTYFENYSQGARWTREYGTVIDSTQFLNLLTYSPLQHIRSQTNYPAILVSLSERDDRVPPASSYKYLATLQKETQSTAPILLQIDRKNPHGSMSYATFYSFIFKELNIKYKPFSFYKDK